MQLTWLNNRSPASLHCPGTAFPRSLVLADLIHSLECLVSHLFPGTSVRFLLLSYITLHSKWLLLSPQASPIITCQVCKKHTSWTQCGSIQGQRSLHLPGDWGRSSLPRGPCCSAFFVCLPCFFGALLQLLLQQESQFQAALLGIWSNGKHY